MKDEINALMSPGLVAQAASLWDATGKVELLDDVTNFVYQFHSNNHWKILRISHSSHQTEKQIIAELDWVNYLAKNAVPVAQPFFSKNQRLTEIFYVGDSYFTAVTFAFAPGQLIENADPLEWNTTLFQTLGRTMGRMHHLAKEYKPEYLAQIRPDWREDDLIRHARDILPQDQMDAADELDQILTLFKEQPTGKDDYGLIHSDVNPTNFHVENGKITLFDFDDCAYNWFVNDIAVAMPLYSHMFSKPDWENHLREYVYWFMYGYEQENQLSDEWLKFLPVCMRVQNIITLVAMHRSNVPGSQYHSFYELVLKTYRESHPLFEYDFLEASKTNP